MPSAQNTFFCQSGIFSGGIFRSLLSQDFLAIRGTNIRCDGSRLPAPPCLSFFLCQHRQDHPLVYQEACWGGHRRQCQKQSCKIYYKCSGMLALGGPQGGAVQASQSSVQMGNCSLHLRAPLFPLKIKGKFPGILCSCSGFEFANG